MQPDQIQVKASKENITQYKNHIQDTEKTWSEHPGM